MTHFIEASLAATPKDKETGQNTSGSHPRTRLKKDMKVMGERRGSITRISRGSWTFYCRMRQSFQQWRWSNTFSESFSSLLASSATVTLFSGCWITLQYVPNPMIISNLLFLRVFNKDHKLKKILAGTLAIKASLWKWELTSVKNTMSLYLAKVKTV